MDTELVRQIGAGIASLDARMLQHQSASAKDRAVTMQKIDDLRDHFEERFDDLGRRIDDVCDTRKEEHGSFEDRIKALEILEASRMAREEGRQQATQAFKDAGKWTVEHGWKAVIVLYISFQTILPLVQQAFALPLHGLQP